MARKWREIRREPQRKAQSRTDLCHGVCRECNRRTWLWLPARICERCVKRHMQENVNAEVLAELERLEAEEADT